MTGDGKARFCSYCQKTVHDLSAMKLEEAERLLCESAGSLCVRFHRAQDGQVVTLDYQEQPKRRSLLWPLTLAAAISALAAGAIFTRKPNPVTPVPVMTVGACLPMPRPTTTPTQSSTAAPAGVMQGTN
jgi:hypothetical protein